MFNPLADITRQIDVTDDGAASRTAVNPAVDVAMNEGDTNAWPGQLFSIMSRPVMLL